MVQSLCTPGVSRRGRGAERRARCMLRDLPPGNKREPFAAIPARSKGGPRRDAARGCSPRPCRSRRARQPRKRACSRRRRCGAAAATPDEARANTSSGTSHPWLLWQRER
eukprot:366346-Chlamydomonas_euryale.AAC.9